jgi:hypothetical protein
MDAGRHVLEAGQRPSDPLGMKRSPVRAGDARGPVIVGATSSDLAYLVIAAPARLREMEARRARSRSAAVTSAHPRESCADP